MSPATSGERRGRRSLPAGLSVCDACGQVRGKTRRGWLSVCLCQGIVCNWCGAPLRRPISDYFDPSDGRWVHVAYFAALGHRCPASSTRKVGRQFTSLPVDDDVRTYQNALTRATMAEVNERLARKAGRARERGS